MEDKKIPIPAAWEAQKKLYQEELSKQPDGGDLDLHEHGLYESFVLMSSFRDNFYLTYKVTVSGGYTNDIRIIEQPLNYSDVLISYSFVDTIFDLDTYMRVISSVDKKYMKYLQEIRK